MNPPISPNTKQYTIVYRRPRRTSCQGYKARRACAQRFFLLIVDFCTSLVFASTTILYLLQIEFQGLIQPLWQIVNKKILCNSIKTGSRIKARTNEQTNERSVTFIACKRGMIIFENVSRSTDNHTHL